MRRPSDAELDQFALNLDDLADDGATLCRGICCACGERHNCGACMGGDSLLLFERGHRGRQRRFEVPR